MDGFSAHASFSAKPTLVGERATLRPGDHGPSAAPDRLGGVRRLTSLLTAGLLAVGLLGAGLLAGCSWHEKICRSAEYPAKAVGNTTGRTCVQKGQNPPSGYVRYPADKEPKYVGDKWDKYWSTVVVDEHGNIVAK